jgi:transcription elongation factor Elf1
MTVHCPHCGYENDVNDLYTDLQGPEVAGVECEDCEQLFHVEFMVTVQVIA